LLQLELESTRLRISRQKGNAEDKRATTSRDATGRCCLHRQVAPHSGVHKPGADGNVAIFAIACAMCGMGRFISVDSPAAAQAAGDGRLALF